MLEEKTRRSDSYWKAFEDWKKLKPVPGIDASKRATREELYDRPRKPVIAVNPFDAEPDDFS